ncbi:hypothetical protein AAE478_003262 [Parahypoxylon ruwenzoriense]
MGRWSYYDTDEERLPEGMRRIGYDADTQTYTFSDAEGAVWESAPGNQYGQLHRVSPPYGDDANNAGEPLHPTSNDITSKEPSWRHEMMPLLNWFLLVGLFLLLVFWFISSAARGVDLTVCSKHSSLYKIHSGDSCWAIAEGHGVPLEALLQENSGIDCDKLSVGSTICIPRV